jgi:hypothetical protein
MPSGADAVRHHADIAFHGLEANRLPVRSHEHDPDRASCPLAELPGDYCRMGVRVGFGDVAIEDDLPAKTWLVGEDQVGRANA